MCLITNLGACSDGMRDPCFERALIDFFASTRKMEALRKFMRPRPVHISFVESKVGFIQISATQPATQQIPVDALNEGYGRLAFLPVLEPLLALRERLRAFFRG